MFLTYWRTSKSCVLYTVFSYKKNNLFSYKKTILCKTRNCDSPLFLLALTSLCCFFDVVYIFKRNFNRNYVFCKDLFIPTIRETIKFYVLSILKHVDMMHFSRNNVVLSPKLNFQLFLYLLLLNKNFYFQFR